MKPLVLLSGGLDSAVVATLAVAASSSEDVVALSFGYGQRHLRELEAAGKIAEHLRIEPIYQEIPISLFSGTLLTGTDKIPQKSYEDFTGLSPMYVPYRNGILLSMATAIALREGCDEVWFGAHKSDWDRWAYPDCHPNFIGAQKNAMYLGSDRKITLVTPHLNRDKVAIVRIASQINAPLQLTYSCYVGNKKQCGECPTCLERIRAFRMNGLRDPIAYEAKIDWKECRQWLR